MKGSTLTRRHMEKLQKFTSQLHHI